MAHGITINMRAIKPPVPKWVHRSVEFDEKGRQLAPGETYTNPDADRTLAGKARRRARKVASA